MEAVFIKSPYFTFFGAARSWVRILHLPVIPEVTLGGHSSGILTVKVIAAK